MAARRYSLIIADRSNGRIRRLTVNVRPALICLAAVLALPMAWLGYARWSAIIEIQQLKHANASLESENAGYRAATTELTAHIASLQAAMTNLVDRSEVDPVLRRAIDRLPAPVKAQAIGEVAMPGITSSALAAPKYAFDLLRHLLSNLDRKLQLVRSRVARHEALEEATPIIWPAIGWLSAGFGYRTDPFTRERTFHPAIDISAQTGDPVYATAAGRIVSVGRSGAYGNLIEIDHGFRLTTRYGHLSRFAVKVGDTVRRGDVIGHVGSTGRATGSHVHYEVWANGRPINPLTLLAEPRPVSAN